MSFFTCSATGYDIGDGSEFIVIGTSTGEVHCVFPKGSAFTKEVGYQLEDSSPITSMKGDPRSKTLAIGTGKGSVFIFTVDSLNSTWSVLHHIQQSVEIPIITIDLVLRGDNLYVVGFGNG